MKPADKNKQIWSNNLECQDNFETDISRLEKGPQISNNI